MKLSELQPKLDALDPTAAKLALRLLQCARGITLPVRISVELALIERSRSAAKLSASDRATLASQLLGHPTNETTNQRDARLVVEACRQIQPTGDDR
ncbi:hypothetical protein VARIO8X_70093 [Burkholderiales bacterium 8X]|nr:hypothetical protein VARIO8X_70093 [Burkholderiales bacterium 8X]